jgi:excisionase family DNA binding protein
LAGLIVKLINVVENNDHKKIRIKEAAAFLGVSESTLRNWDKNGQLKALRSIGNQRFYLFDEIKKFKQVNNLNQIGYIWVKSEIPPTLPSEYYCERQDRFTSRVSKMGTELQDNEGISVELASLIPLVVGEIGDNSFAHNTGNWPDVPGVYYAYDLRRRIIVLADRGRGVKETLKRVRPSLETDQETLEVAFNEVISGRNPEKRGNGLKVVRNVIESNEIGLRYQSGIAVAFVLKNKPGTLKIILGEENIRGTFCVILF